MRTYLVARVGIAQAAVHGRKCARADRNKLTTTVYLEAYQDEGLTLMSRNIGRPKSELIRIAIDRLLGVSSLADMAREAEQQS